MFERLIAWVKNLFGKEPGRETRAENARSEDDRKKYEDDEKTSFTAIFAGYLANKTVADSSMIITDQEGKESRRSAFIQEAMSTLWAGMKETVDNALGKGGVFLVPYAVGNRVYVARVDQADCLVTGSNGAGEITSISIRAEEACVGPDTYIRIVDYTLTDGNLQIKNVAINRYGKQVPMATVPEWAGITEEINMAGVDRMPIGYLKCPKSNRKTGRFYGVPITYGCGETMEHLHECLGQIRREYELKNVFVGVEEHMFGKENRLPKGGLFKLFTGAGALTGNGGNFWEIFDPEIRDASYYNRYTKLCEQLEKEVGTSKGVLTKPENNGTTAYEVKANNADTFAIVSDVRKNIEMAMDAVAYGVDTLAEYFGLTPVGATGDYKITFDWDFSMVENSSETFQQLSELESRGLISGARLNAFVTGQSIEEAQTEIDARAEEDAKKAAPITAEDLEP